MSLPILSPPDMSVANAVRTSCVGAFVGLRHLDAAVYRSTPCCLFRLPVKQVSRASHVPLASYHLPPHLQQSQARHTTVANCKTVMRYAGMKPPIAHTKLALRTRTIGRVTAAPLQESSALASSSASAAASVTVPASIRTQATR